MCASKLLIGEGRPVWKTVPVRLGVTLIMLVLLVISAAIASLGRSPPSWVKRSALGTPR